MDKNIIKFDDTEIEKYEFHQFKYFIGYKDNKKIKALCVFFQEANVYRIDLDETECMSFLMKDF